MDVVHETESTSGGGSGDASTQQQIGTHKKLCRVVRGQRVVLGSTPPKFVVELRPVASGDFNYPLLKSGDVVGGFGGSDPGLGNLLESLDSDACYSSESEHSALSRNASEASETLAQECSNSPTCNVKCCSVAMAGVGGVGVGVGGGGCGEYGGPPPPILALNGETEFSKLSLQDSGYGGSLPLLGSESPVCNGVPSRQTPPLESPPQTDYYASLLEFTLKLGYNESQLRSVLTKLGASSPGQDKVLSELIKLGQDVQEMSPGSASGGNDSIGGLHLDGVHRSQPDIRTCGGGGGAGNGGGTVAGGLRSIVVDGSNVAMTHGNKVVFSCLGIRSCVEWFRQRGHCDIKVFVPQFRKETPRSDNPITDQHILFELEKENVLVWTPSRRFGGRRIVCHDDRYILKTAVDKDAVIVSNDEYRDLISENADFRKAVEERLLMYNFIDGRFIVPDDPLGRYGPKLDQFLSKKMPCATAPPCPYGRKCTYGNKCKFYHPERPGGLHRSVTERLRDHAELHRRISPTNSLQHTRVCATDSFLTESSSMVKSAQRATACRTQSLNPAALLRQQSPSPNEPASRDNSPSSFAQRSEQQQQQQQLTGGGHHSLGQSDSCGYATPGGPAPFWPAMQRVQRPTDGGGRSAAKRQSSHAESRSDSSASKSGYRVAGNGLLMPPTVSYMQQQQQQQNWQQQQQQQQQQHGGDGHPSEQQRHQPVGRNMSAPGVNLLRMNASWQSQQTPRNGTVCADQRKNSVSDTQLNLLAGLDEDDEAVFCNSNYYIPSTTVWGPVEHSSSPVFTNVQRAWSSAEQSQIRSKVYYHLSQLFSEDLVATVMRSNPIENDPQKLCTLILKAQALAAARQA